MAVLIARAIVMPGVFASIVAARRVSRRSGAIVFAALLCLGATSAAQPVAQQPLKPTEADVKAEYLYKFTEYITWPPGALERSPAFTFCVVADGTFTGLLGQVLHNRRVGQKLITVQRPQNSTAARQCHVLYLSREEFARSDWLVEALEHSAVLLVSDAADFLDRGGTIALVLEGTRVRYDVSLSAAKRSGLTISSRLLRSARKVIDPGGGR